MKKILIPLLFTLAFILCSCQPQQSYSGEMDAVNCHSITFGDKTIQNISVILYQSKTPNFQSCSEEIIQHCLNNDFRTIQFSYDMHGYPVELNATVYLTESDFKNGTSLFSMKYAQPTETNLVYDIKNNPEMFSLTIQQTK